MSDTDALTLATHAVQMAMLGRQVAIIKPEELARAALEAAGVLADGAQPLPEANDYPSCHDLAIGLLEANWTTSPERERLVADMVKRKAHGLAKYGVLLQPFNGRRAITDAYEEALDLVVYWTQYAYEQRVALGIDHFGMTDAERHRNRVLGLALYLARLQPG